MWRYLSTCLSLTSFLHCEISWNPFPRNNKDLFPLICVVSTMSVAIKALHLPPPTPTPHPKLYWMRGIERCFHQYLATDAWKIRNRVDSRQYNSQILHRYSLGQISIMVKFDINSLWPDDTISRHRSQSTLVQVISWCLTAPLLEPMLIYH